MANIIAHLEIPVTDLEKAKRFYSEVFGWKIHERLGFILFETDPKSVGGSFKKVDEVKGGGITFYISVDDIDEKIQEIVKAGGKAISEKVEIPKVGWQASFADAFGNVLLLFRPYRS